MAEIKIGRMTMGMCQTNCYFLYREGCSEVMLFDPPTAGRQIYDKLKEKGFEVKMILLTHAHFDHIMGCNELIEASGAKLYAFCEEQLLCENPKVNLSTSFHQPYTVKPDVYLKEGDTVTMGDVSCKVIATPGHTKGSCCFYFEEAGFLVAGDTVFLESVGRSDFPTGSAGELIRSIKEKLFVLPDNTKVYPGHGDSTTIEHEKKYNPFCV